MPGIAAGCDNFNPSGRGGAGSATRIETSGSEAAIAVDHAARRYWHVVELLDVGIDVDTTLNSQMSLA
jgi:hypothetical protein